MPVRPPPTDEVLHIMLSGKPSFAAMSRGKLQATSCRSKRSNRPILPYNSQPKLNMAPQPWKTLSTREIYKNPWIRLREDIAELPNGKTTIYSVCEMNECVGVLPFVDDEHVVMVRQYRYVFDDASRWEMPTGGCKPSERPEQAAQRELAEEIGYRAGVLQHINTHWTSKSVCREVAHLFIGRHLTRVHADEIVPDDTELLEIRILSFKDVLGMVMDSEIRDAMTVIAVLWAAAQTGLRP